MEDKYQFKKRNMMPVRCISERSSRPNQITVGKAYLIDRNSIWIDNDGDVFGMIFNTDGSNIGQMKLSHFTSLA